MSYTIGQISQKMNLSEYTIRYYEKEGLFPFITRNNHGERVFDERDLHFLEVIVCLKKTGMPLEDIRKYIQWAGEGDQSIQERYELFTKQKQKIDAQIKQLQVYQECIDYKCRYYKKAMEAGTLDIYKDDPEDDMPIVSIIDLEEGK